MHFLQCLDTSHELESVMTRVVSTNVTFEGTLLNQLKSCGLSCTPQKPQPLFFTL